MTINQVGNVDWPINYSLYDNTKWRPWIYPRFSTNPDIERINAYQQLVQPKFYYNWVLGKTIDVWV